VIDLQALMDGMGAQMQRERASSTQMTLGEVIARLEEMHPAANIYGLVNPDSYRGYYCDLAFAPINAYQRADQALKTCRGCMGKVFQGYKGGSYVMGELTPVWISNYGDCGKKLMAIGDDGMLEVEDDE